MSTLWETAQQEDRIIVTRRNYFKLTGVSTLGWYVATDWRWAERAVAQIPGGTLDPGAWENTGPRC